MGGGLRYFAGTGAFGFAAIWIVASLAAALVCLLSAMVAYAGVSVCEHVRAKRAQSTTSASAVSTSRVISTPRRAPEVAELPLWADALKSDLGYVYEPGATMAPLARETAYGWPLTDDTATVSEPLQ